jgi:hypothetical protein
VPATDTSRYFRESNDNSADLPTDLPAGTGLHLKLMHEMGEGGRVVDPMAAEMAGIQSLENVGAQP